MVKYTGDTCLTTSADIAAKNETNAVPQMPTFQMDYTKKTRDELIAICKDKHIRGYSGMKKDEIIDLVERIERLRAPLQVPVRSPHNTPSNEHTFIEVCAGCGGLSTGFIEAGFKSTSCQ